MRVLQVNKFGWLNGGAESYMLRVCEQLAARPGTEVALWAADPTPMVGVRPYDVSIPNFQAAHGVRGKLDAATTVLWSRAAQSALNSVLDDFKPDVVHLHNYAHQFSSSIIDLLRRRGIRSVATAHDYKLICPAYLAVRDGHDCFDCGRKLSLTPVRARCLHRRVSWSSVALVEAKVVRARRLTPDVVLAPSQFMADRLGASWLSADTEIDLLHYAVDPSGVNWEGGSYLLYAGRLSAEKGVDELIERARELRVPLVVAGDGPERNRLEALAEGDAEITFVGYVSQGELHELRRQCLAQVIPSGWPENFPLTSLEAAADGVPLIISARGGMPELLMLGARGAVLSTHDLEGWRQAIADVSRLDPTGALGELARFREELSWENHMPRLMTIYGAAGPASATGDEVAAVRSTTTTAAVS